LHQQPKKLLAVQATWVEPNVVQLTRILLPELIPANFVRSPAIISADRREAQAPEPGANEICVHGFCGIPRCNALAEILQQLSGPHNDPVERPNPINEDGEERCLGAEEGTLFV